MRLIGAASIVFITTLVLATSTTGPAVTAVEPAQSSAGDSAKRHRDNDRPEHRFGRKIFREDTFGDEQLWTDVLQMHNVIGDVPPVAALGLGLKVDVDVLPAEVIAAISAGQGLDDPATTVALLQLNAVVGVRAKVNDLGQVTSFGITCALCHSTVDDSLTTGVGHRLDGWANPTSTSARSPRSRPSLTTPPRPNSACGVPADYDPRHHAFDGTNIIPLNTPSVPVDIPAIYGLKGVGFETFTGDGPISYWNSYVGVGQMGGQGTFFDPRIGLFIRQKPDLVTPKLRALLFYQLSLEAPPPPDDSFDRAAARRGKRCSATKLVAPTAIRGRPSPTCWMVRGGGCRDFTIRKKSAPIPRTPHEAPRAGTERRPCARSGNTRRTSTTGARPISRGGRTTTTSSST